MDLSRIVLALLAQCLSLLLAAGPDKLDEATQQRMRERQEMLSREMTRLWQEVSQDSQSSSAWAALRFAASQQWHIWALSALLILLFGLCCWLWKSRSRNEGGMEQQEEVPGIAMEEQQEEDPGIAMEEQQEEDPGIAMAVDRISHTPFTLVPPELINSLYDVMTDLLRSCIKRSRGDFFPVLHTPITVSCKSEVRRPLQYRAVYRMVVPVKAPRGHSFHLERCGTGRLRSRKSRIRVELKCTCEKQQPGEDMLCFLHHRKEELSRNQAPSLLDTLCSGSYLDMGKTSHWFGTLVRSSWLALPDRKGCKIDVLIYSPIGRLCIYWSPDVYLLVELRFAVKEDDSFSGRSIDWQRPV